MTTILVLGHKGMLGRSVTAHFKTQSNVDTVTINSRWGDEFFSENIQNVYPDYIINCIGKIPQKNPAESEYNFLNIELPRFLETLGVRIIHPSTDCEFKGDIPVGTAYTKTSIRDADDIYGLSKALISAEIENSFSNTKIIRTSIIGHEENTTLSLLDWFLSRTESTRGYTNHYWNGITTLEWAKQALTLIANWDNRPTLNQIGFNNHHSKFEILTLAKTVYQKDIEIIPFDTEMPINKCLESDFVIPDLSIQLAELREFFKR
jgi:dTDP-4-dehydrorhamnose reductase